MMWADYVPAHFIWLDLPLVETPFPVWSHFPIPHLCARTINSEGSLWQQIHFTKKQSFPLRLSSVNVTKSAGNIIFCVVIGISTHIHNHPDAKCVVLFRVFRLTFLDLSDILTLVCQHILSFQTNLSRLARANTCD